jgi:phosphoglycolate phosphatase-like HAD superfamily hydrolase
MRAHACIEIASRCGTPRCVLTPLSLPFPPPPPHSFSSDYCSNQLADHSVDRAEFIRVASRKAAALPGANGGGAGLAHRVIHFGDTPNDVRAAAAAGALPVGLATGAFTLAQLREAAVAAGVADTAVLLPDLRDTAAVLKAMGL